MTESATYSMADMAKEKGEDTPVNLADEVAKEMNQMVADGEDLSTYNGPGEATQEAAQEPTQEADEEVNEVLEDALSKGYDPDYEGDDAKTPEEFVAYSDDLNLKKAQERENKEYKKRIERLEKEKSVLAENDASNLRQKILDLGKFHKEAVEEGDYDRVTAIQKQMEETKSQLYKVNQLTNTETGRQSDTSPGISEGAQTIIDDFEADNTWLADGNDVDTQIAQTIFNKYLVDNPSNNQVNMVRGAIAAVKDKLPSRFKQINKARNKPSDSVKGKGRTPKASQITERDLSQEELSAFKAFKRSGTYKTVQEFYTDIKETR